MSTHHLIFLTFREGITGIYVLYRYDVHDATLKNGRLSLKMSLFQYILLYMYKNQIYL